MTTSLLLSVLAVLLLLSLICPQSAARAVVDAASLKQSCPLSRAVRGEVSATATDSAPWEKTNITGLPWAEFQALKKEEKQSRLWKATSNSSYPKDRLPNATLSSEAASRTFLPRYPSESFLWPSDILPLDREGVKIFHTYGIAGTGEVTIDPQSRFSGLLGVRQQNGSAATPNPSPVLIRLSEGSVGKNMPGIAVKFLIDGRPSENIVAIHSLNVQSTSYFFENELTTVIPVPQGALLLMLSAVLREGQEISIPAKEIPVNARTIPMDRLTRVYSDGTTPDEVSTPAKLFFVPTADVKKLVDPADTRDFRLILSDIPPNTAIYRLFGCPSLNNCDSSNDTNSYYVGQLTLTSELIMGPYEDQQLGFQHPTAMNSHLEGGCPFASQHSR